MTHLTPKTLAGLEAGTLAPPDEHDAREHVRGCAHCEARRDELVATARLLGQLELSEIAPASTSWARIEARIAAPPESQADVAAQVAIACAYCKGRLARPESVYCAACLAPHHDDCWDEHGKCAACAEAARVRAESPRVARVSPGLLRRVAFAACACAACFVGFVGLWQSRVTTTGRPTSTSREQLVREVAVENRIVDARRLVRDARERLRSHDTEGAIAGAHEAVRLLDEVDPRGEWPRAEEVRSQALALLGDAWAARGSREGLAKAEASYRDAFEHASGPVREEIRCKLAHTLARLGRPGDALSTYASVPATSPSHVTARLGAAKVYRDIDQADRARAELDRVAGTDVTGEVRARVLVARGEVLLELDEPALAKKDFDWVVEHRESDDAGFRGRAIARAALGDVTGALDDATEAIDLQPSFPENFHARGRIHLAQRKLSEAIKDFEVAITRSAEYWPAYLGLARARELSLDYDLAESTWKDVIDADADDAKPYRARALAAKGRLLAQRSDRLGVLAELDAAERLENERRRSAGRPPLALGELVADAASERAKRGQQALEHFEKALALEPSLVDALVGRAWLRLAQSDAKAAIPDLEAARAKLGNRKPGAALAEVEALLGRALLFQGDVPRATERFEAALAADRRCTLAVAGLAAAYARRYGDQTAEARALFREARTAEQLPGIDEESYFLAEGRRLADQALRSGKIEYTSQARECFARVSAANPWHGIAFLERARLAVSVEAWDVALQDVDCAIQADPYLREAFELRGFLFARDLPAERDPRTLRPREVRDRAKAIAAFTRAIEIADQRADAGDALYGRALALADGSHEDRDLARADVSAAIDTLPAAALVKEDLDGLGAARVNAAIAYHLLRERLVGIEGKGESSVLKARAKRAARLALERGRALREKRSYSLAIEQLDRAIALDPELAQAFYERGTCYSKSGNFVPGILDFSHALELDPSFADGFYNKTYQASYVVDLNRVITELNKVVADHPRKSYVLFLRGYFYVAKTEFKKYDRTDVAAGVRDFDRTLELNPKHVSALIYRGFLRYKSGLLASANEAHARVGGAPSRTEELDAALADYRAAAALDERVSVPYFLEAMVWAQRATDAGAAKGDLAEKAIASLEKAFEKGFRGFDRIKNDRAFEPIRDDPRVQKLLQRER